jgi:hypothetical protein
MPVGLTIDRGTVVNPVIQRFEGILIIRPDGKIYLTHIDDIKENEKNLSIRTSFSDYLEFINTAIQNKLTVIQPHLLINDGSILVENDQKQVKFHKRVLFQTADGGMHVYESLKRQQSVYEVAKFVKANNTEGRAVNLETGTYDFCTINRDNKLINRSQLKKGEVLSNLLIFDY